MSERTVARTVTRPLSGAYSLELLGMSVISGRVNIVTPDPNRGTRRT